MRNKLILLALVVALASAITLTHNNQVKTEQKLNNQIKQLEAKTKEQQRLEVENLKKEIENVRQSKAAEKARLAAIEAAKKPVVSKVVQSIVPTAQAATGSCSEWMRAAGVTDIGNASILINRESGCNPNAVNKSSGACGIPQALPCSKLGTNDPVAQIRWMQNYVNARYGGWAGAVAWHNSHNWY